MQKSSKLAQKRLNRKLWLAKLSEELEQIPDNTRVCSLVEKQAILLTLIQVEGNRALAARQLQISKRGLYNKLKKYGLSKE